MADTPYVEDEFPILDFRINVEFSTEEMLRQVQNRLSDPSLEVRITGNFMLVGPPQPHAEIVLSCDFKHDKIALSWL